MIYHLNGKFTICGLPKLIEMMWCRFAKQNSKFSNPKPEFCHRARVSFREFAFLKFANPNKLTINRCLHLMYYIENQKNNYA